MNFSGHLVRITKYCDILLSEEWIICQLVKQLSEERNIVFLEEKTKANNFSSSIINEYKIYFIATFILVKIFYLFCCNRNLTGKSINKYVKKVQQNVKRQDLIKFNLLLWNFIKLLEIKLTYYRKQLITRSFKVKVHAFATLREVFFSLTSRIHDTKFVSRFYIVKNKVSYSVIKKLYTSLIIP